MTNVITNLARGPKETGMDHAFFQLTRATPDRLQSKMRLTINEPGSKIAGNSVFDCIGQEIENSVSNYF